MRTFIIFIALVLSGCASPTYPPSHEKYMKNHTGEFEYDKVCTKGEYCRLGRPYLMDYKLAKLEQTENTKNNVGEKYNKLLNNEYKKSELDMDCYKTMTELVKQSFIGCYDSIEVNEISLEEVGTKRKEVRDIAFIKQLNDGRKEYTEGRYVKTVRTATSVNGNTTEVTTVRPTERNCAIKLAVQIQNVKSFCSTTYWKENEDTREFYKELAEDGMLASTYIRGSMSFDQKNPKTLVEGKCKVKSCENEFKLVNGEFGDSPAYAKIFDGKDKNGRGEVAYNKETQKFLRDPLKDLKDQANAQMSTAEKIGLIMKVVEPLMFVIYPIKAFFTLVKDMSTQIVKDNL